MSFFATSLDKLSTADLSGLMADGAVENVRLEFKREIPTKDETLKKITSFANTYGGVMVIGAEASSTDGRLVALPGVDVERGYKQRLVQWAYDGVFPPVTLRVSAPIPSPADPSKVCYVIEVPDSEEAPHFINGRKGAFVRSDEFSQRFRPELATYEEIQHLANRRQVLVNRRVNLQSRSVRRFEAYAEGNYTEHPRTTGSIGATALISASPIYPSKELVTETQLDEIVRNRRITWRQEGFPRTHSPITQHESAILLDGAWTFSMLEATIWGHVFLGMELEEERETESGEKANGIHLYGFVGKLLAYFEYLRQVYELIGYSGPLEIRVELIRIRGIPFIVFPRNVPKVSPTSPIDGTVALKFRASTDILSSERDRLVRDIIRTLLYALNWSEQIRDDAKLETLLQFGHWYSFWRESEPAT